MLRTRVLILLLFVFKVGLAIDSVSPAIEKYVLSVLQAKKISLSHVKILSSVQKPLWVQKICLEFPNIFVSKKGKEQFFVLTPALIELIDHFIIRAELAPYMLTYKHDYSLYKIEVKITQEIASAMIESLIQCAGSHLFYKEHGKSTQYSNLSLRLGIASFALALMEYNDRCKNTYNTRYMNYYSYYPYVFHNDSAWDTFKKGVWYGTIALTVCAGAIAIYQYIYDTTSCSYESMDKEMDLFIPDDIQNLTAMIRWCTFYENLFFHIYSYDRASVRKFEKAYGKELPAFLQDHIYLKGNMFHGVMVNALLDFNPAILSAIPATIAFQTRKQQFKDRLEKQGILDMPDSGMIISIYYDNQLLKEEII